MVTTLKDTAKPVTDLPFPAVTICASGLHMDNVERKLRENFSKWRVKNSRNEENREAIEKDIKDYMHQTFQIKPEDSDAKSMNILDILDTMIAPNVDASVAANGVRENALACKDVNDQTEDTQGRKRRSTCTCSCKNATYKLSGNNCFGVSKVSLSFNDAVTECSARGGQLATIASQEDDTIVESLMAPSSEYEEQGYWIGLNDLKEEGTFVWQDESSLTYENWADGQPDGGNSNGNGNNGNGNGNGRDRDCVTKSVRNDKGRSQKIKMEI